MGRKTNKVDCREKKLGEEDVNRSGGRSCWLVRSYPIPIAGRKVPGTCGDGG